MISIFRPKAKRDISTEFMLENRIADLLEENRNLESIANAAHQLFQTLLVNDAKGERIVSIKCDDEFMANVVRHCFWDLQSALYGTIKGEVFKMEGVTH